MKVSAEKIDKNKVELTVEVSEEQFEQSLQKAYKKVVHKVNIPGFRKGKAPRRVLENIYGIEVLFEEALQDAVPTAYKAALEEVKGEYTPVSEPEYDVVQVEKNKPLIFKAVFYNKPEVTLGQYKELELEKTPIEIKEEDITAELGKMQQRYAKMTVIEEAAAQGDVLNIDFVGKVDGQPFEGGTASDYPLELGSNTFIPGFEEQLIGVAPGSTVDVSVNFPEEYHAEDLAGKAAVFTVNVKEIKRKELAPLDDEFAKDVSEFATLQELRTDIENKLKEAAERKANSDLRLAAVKKASENAQVDIPEPMIEQRVNRMIESFAMRLAQQGISFDYYLQATNSKIENLKENYRAEAEESTKADLVLEAIAKTEDIKSSPEELEEEISKMAEAYKQDVSTFRETLEKEGQMPNLEFGIMMDKTVEFIVEHAIV